MGGEANLEDGDTDGGGFERFEEGGGVADAEAGAIEEVPVGEVRKLEPTAIRDDFSILFSQKLLKIGFDFIMLIKFVIKNVAVGGVMGEGDGKNPAVGAGNSTGRVLEGAWFGAIEADFIGGDEGEVEVFSWVDLAGEAGGVEEIVEGVGGLVSVGKVDGGPGAIDVGDAFTDGGGGDIFFEEVNDFGRGGVIGNAFNGGEAVPVVGIFFAPVFEADAFFNGRVTAGLELFKG